MIMVEKQLVESRQLAQSMIMAGQVFIDNQKILKAGTFVSDDVNIVLKGSKLPYVSRGGLKLEKALHTFSIDLQDICAMDVGASTGGFTDCMLQNGASKVYAVDVGYGQLAWKLRNDPRVICMERTNVRYLTPDMIEDKLDFISIDVSFISLKLIFPVLRSLMKDTAKIVCLIKPQFEAGKENIGKKGVVRDPDVHYAVLEQFLEHAKENELYVHDITFSPVRGPEGNIEYLGFLGIAPTNIYSGDLRSLVEESHHSLGGSAS